MKITQNPETGKLEFRLDAGEEPDTEERLQALMDFVTVQAQETYRHTHSYRKIVGRLDELEQKINLLTNGDFNRDYHGR